MAEPAPVSLAEFQQMADRAGLGISPQEVAELKPIYDLYAAYARQLHEINFGAAEIAVEFRPDWPES